MKNFYPLYLIPYSLCSRSFVIQLEKSNCFLWNSQFLCHRDTGSSAYIYNTKVHHCIYEGVFKSFRTGHLERELQMLQLSATRCSCIAVLW